LNQQFDVTMNRTIMNYFNEQKYKLLFHKVNLKCIRQNQWNTMSNNMRYIQNHCLFIYIVLIYHNLVLYTIIICFDLSKYFHIVVTYSIGFLEKVYSHMTILKIPNNGLDIGAKMMMVKYLKDKDITYDYIYFMPF